MRSRGPDGLDGGAKSRSRALPNVRQVGASGSVSPRLPTGALNSAAASPDSRYPARPAIAARCLEFAILIATRSSEALGARWDEIDLGTKAWTIPAFNAKTGRRMKAGHEQRVPLADRVMELGRNETAHSWRHSGPAPKSAFIVHGSGNDVTPDELPRRDPSRLSFDDSRLGWKSHSPPPRVS
jgi:integrase